MFYLSIFSYDLFNPIFIIMYDHRLIRLFFF